MSTPTHTHTHTRKQYKNKYRSLQFNLKDKKNISLRERILKGEVTPSNLVRFSSQELGNEDLQAALESIQESSLKNVFKPVASSTTMSVAAPLSDQSLSLSSLSSSKAEGGDVAKGGVKQPLAAEGVLPTKKVVTHVPPPPKAPIKIFPKKAEFKSLDEILSRMEKASAPRAHDSLDPLPTRSPVTAIRPPIDSHSDRKEKIEIVSKRQSAETLWEGKTPWCTQIASRSRRITGKLGMHQVGRFSGYAFQVFGPWMGNKNIWADLLSSSLMIEGRIPTSAAGAYVSESAASKDIVVFALSPGRPPVESQQSIVEQSDAVAYQTLFDYFATRARYGVVPHPDRGSRLRDSYIMPLGRNEELPTCLRDLASDNGQFYLDPVPRPSDLLLCVLILIRGSSIKKGAPRKSNGSHSVSKPSGSSRDQRHSERPMETSQPRGPMYSPPVASFSLPVQNAPAIAASGLLANLMSGTAPMSQYPQQNQQQYQQQHHQMPFAPQPQQFQQSQIQQPPAIQLPPNLDISGLLAQLQGVLGNQPPQRPPH